MIQLYPNLTVYVHAYTHTTHTGSLCLLVSFLFFLVFYQTLYIETCTHMFMHVYQNLQSFSPII